jgi:hypothetical protein
MLVTIPFHDQIGFDKGMIVGYTTMVLAFLLVYYGVKSYRDNVAGGRVSFGQAFKVGILISLVAATCYVATWQVVYRTIAPDYGEKYMEYTLDKERQAGATEGELAAKQAEMTEFWELYKNPVVNIGLTYLEPLPVALIFTLVSAGIFSRKRREDKPATA